MQPTGNKLSQAESPQTKSKPHVHSDFGVSDYTPSSPSGNLALPHDPEAEKTQEGKYIGRLPTWILTSVRARKARPSAIYIPKGKQAPDWNRQTNQYHHGDARTDSKYTHALGPVSRNDFPVIHRELQNYNLSDDASESNYSPASTVISPMTLKDELNFYSSIVDQGVNNEHLEYMNEPDHSTLEETFSLASSDFFAGFDVESLLSDGYELHDNDQQKGLPQVFDFNPHHRDYNCYCYHCQLAEAAEAFGYPAHDYSIWCPCMNCRMMKMREDAQRAQASFDKKSKSLRTARVDISRKSGVQTNTSGRLDPHGPSGLFELIRTTLR